MIGMTGTTDSSRQAATGNKQSPAHIGRPDASTDTAVANRLHATLDIHQLINTFIHELRKSLPCDGIQYSENSIRLELVDGELGLHRCTYNLEYTQHSLGTITVTREHAFHEHETDRLEGMLAGLVLPLHNAIRYQQAVHFARRDELTGLRNSSYYYDNVELEIQRAHRYKTPFSLILIDLDDFDKINSQYGHDTGDAVLVEQARRLEREARSSDIAYRNGGDAFLLFLPNTEQEAAMRVAHRIKSMMMEKACMVGQYSIHVSLSMGVVSVMPKDTVFKLLNRGDRALFHAKILGKNRIHADLITEPLQTGEI